MRRGEGGRGIVEGSTSARTETRGDAGDTVMICAVEATTVNSTDDDVGVQRRLLGRGRSPNTSSMLKILLVVRGGLSGRETASGRGTVGSSTGDPGPVLGSSDSRRGATLGEKGRGIVDGFWRCSSVNGSS